MSLPVSVVITGCDSLRILQQALDAVHSYLPMTGEQRMTLLSKTAKAASQGEYEGYKTGKKFDATDMHPEWLG
jgi:hypothetical protein